MEITIIKVIMFLAIIVMAIKLAVDKQSMFWGTFAVCWAFYAGWTIKNEIFLIDFKEMLDLVKKVSKYDNEHDNNE